MSLGVGMKRHAILLTAVLGLVPQVALGVGSGMGLYGTASFGGGGGGNATSENAREDYDKATQLMDKGDYGDAVPYLVRTLRVAQGNPGILNDLGYAARMSGDYDTAIDYLQRAIDRGPNQLNAYVNLGEVYLTLHQPDKAKAALTALDQVCPGVCAEKDTLAGDIAAYKIPAPPKDPSKGP